MCRLFCIVIFLTYCTISNSQISWESLPIPDSIKIVSIGINSNSSVFLGAQIGNNKGALYKSIDTGCNWIELGFYPHGIGSLEIDDLSNTYCGGRKSNDIGIFKSTDYGISWDYKYYSQMALNITYYSNGLLYSIGHNNGYNILKSQDYGESWDEYPFLQGGSNAFQDLLVTSCDSVYFAITNWFEGGGIFLTKDGGLSHDVVGLYNYHVYALAANSNNDVFAGTYSSNLGSYFGGIFVQRKGNNTWDSLCNGYINDLLINKDDYIFAAMPQGVLASFDNGQSFEFINAGLFSEEVNNLAIDSNGYIYATSYNPCHLAKTLQTTVGYNDDVSDYSECIRVFPNPFHDRVNFQLPDISRNKCIEIKIFSNTGICHFNKIHNCNGSNVISFTSSILSLIPGIYYYQIIVSGKTYTGKLIKL